MWFALCAVRVFFGGIEIGRVGTNKKDRGDLVNSP